MGKDTDSQAHTRDFLALHDHHEGRIQALESGAHPVRYDWGPGVTTPWFALDNASGWTGSTYWRVARTIVQLRGALEGPSGWSSDHAFDLPGEIIPAWELEMIAMHSNGAPLRVRIRTDGLAVAYRADTGTRTIILDSIRFPRG